MLAEAVRRLLPSGLLNEINNRTNDVLKIFQTVTNAHKRCYGTIKNLKRTMTDFADYDSLSKIQKVLVENSEKMVIDYGMELYPIHKQLTLNRSNTKQRYRIN